MTFINRCAYFSTTQNKDMRISRALIKPRCTLLKRSYKGAAFFYGFHKIVVHNFEALTMGSNAHRAKWIKHACRMWNL